MASKRVCSIPDCGKPVYGHDLCSAHYSRNRRNGDPLAGKTSPGKTTEYLHDVVMHYSGDDCLIWPFARRKGYGMIRLGGVLQTVSRYVCRAKNGEPPTPQHEAAHSCGNGHLGCVTANHMRWATSAENKHDMNEHGTAIRGESHPHSKLTEHQVRQIKSMLGTRAQTEIAQLLGIAIWNVNHIARGKNWASIK